VASKSTRKKKTKKVVPKGYDSRLEYDLHNNELKGWNYHPEERIYYDVPSSYEPDFVTEVCLQDGSNLSKDILVEVKGRFRTRPEASKYIHIRESFTKEASSKDQSKEKLSKEKELIFIFQDADKPMPFAGKRKDGTKQSHGEWASKNKFRFFCLKRGLPTQWLQDLT
jgi:hypothetical protein